MNEGPAGGTSNVFHVHGAAADGSVLFRKKLNRPQLVRFAVGRN